ncbi:MAG: hypothetical protein IPJ30_26455 [Acidobacteria bacterium]|nr:hypothetical protein [Acidobacteriota bacterium]
MGRRIQRIVGNGRENTKFVYDGLDVVMDDDFGVLTKYRTVWDRQQVESRLTAFRNTSSLIISGQQTR